MGSFSTRLNTITVYPSVLKSIYTTRLLNLLGLVQKGIFCSYIKWSLKLSILNENWNGSTIFVKFSKIRRNLNRFIRSWVFYAYGQTDGRSDFSRQSAGLQALLKIIIFRWYVALRSQKEHARRKDTKPWWRDLSAGGRGSRWRHTSTQGRRHTTQASLMLMRCRNSYSSGWGWPVIICENFHIDNPTPTRHTLIVNNFWRLWISRIHSRDCYCNLFQSRHVYRSIASRGIVTRDAQPVVCTHDVSRQRFLSILLAIKIISIIMNVIQA
jgi:hypothetical protein